MHVADDFSYNKYDVLHAFAQFCESKLLFQAIILNGVLQLKMVVFNCKIFHRTNYTRHKVSRTAKREMIKAERLLKAVDHNEKDGGMYILPESIAKIKNK